VQESAHEALPQSNQLKEVFMKALSDLFSTDYGLMTVAGLSFMIGMGVWFYRYFMRKMDEDAKAAGLPDR
jgi:hypothetical protein